MFVVDDKKLLMDCLPWDQESLHDIVINGAVAEKIKQREDVLRRLEKSRSSEAYDQRVNPIRYRKDRRKRQELWRHGRTGKPEQRESIEDTSFGSEPLEKKVVNPPYNYVFLNHLASKYGYAEAIQMHWEIDDQDALVQKAQEMSARYQQPTGLLLCAMVQFGEEVTAKLLDYSVRHDGIDIGNILDHYDRAIKVDGINYLLAGELSDRLQSEPLRFGIIKTSSAKDLIESLRDQEDVAFSKEGKSGEIPQVTFVDFFERGTKYDLMQEQYRSDPTESSHFLEHTITKILDME